MAGDAEESIRDGAVQGGQFRDLDVAIAHRQPTTYIQEPPAFMLKSDCSWNYESGGRRLLAAAGDA